MATIHTLKTINPYFERVWTGAKLAEIRKNDRDFQKQDLLQLQEFDPKRGYSGREIVARVIDIVQENTFEGLSPGYCLMSLKVLDQTYYGSVFKSPASALPTCPEETGCAGCPEKGLTDACDKCSPPLKNEAKTVPAEHHTAGNPKKTRASGPMKPGRSKGNKYGIPTELAKTDKKLFDRLWQRCKTHGIMYEEALNLKPAKAGRKPKAPAEKDLPKPGDCWSIEEDAAIRECPNEDMALTHFLNKFPESERTAVEVSQRWQELRGQADEAAEAEA